MGSLLTSGLARKVLFVADCAMGYPGDPLDFRRPHVVRDIFWVACVLDLVSHDISVEYTDDEVFEHIRGMCMTTSHMAWNGDADTVMSSRVFGHSARRLREDILAFGKIHPKYTLGSLSNYHMGRIELEIHVR